MFAQSVIITAIIIVMSFGFLTVKKKKWFLTTIPLCFLPLSNSIMCFVYKYIYKTDFNHQVVIIVLIISTVLSCAVLGVCALRFLNRNDTRVIYFSGGAIFNILLSIILFNHYFI